MELTENKIKYIQFVSCDDMKSSELCISAVAFNNVSAIVEININL